MNKKPTSLEFLTIKEVAAILRVGNGKIRSMIREGAFVPTRTRGRAMISAQNVWNVLLSGVPDEG